MPPKIYLLSLGSLLERSSYYGMLTVLVLYLNKAFSFSDSMSFLFYGAYTTFAFAFPVIGGYIADRFLGARHAMILGLVFLIVGNLFISFPQYYFFCIGVSCLILGTGIYKPTSTSFFGKYCQSIKLSEEKGFTIFYVAMNIGGMLGPIAYGLIAQSSKWGYSFLCSAIMLIFFLVSFIKYIKVDQPITEVKKTFNLTCSYLILLILAAVFYTLFFYQIIFEKITMATFFLLIPIALFVFRKSLMKSKSTIAIFVLLIFVTLFFSCSLQVVSSINLFVERNINREFYNFMIPTTFFAALYPCAVIITAPLLVIIFNFFPRISAPFKITLSLFFTAAAFIFFLFATKTSFQSHISILWIIFGNLLLGVGEVCVMPTILSMISQYSSENLHSTMMGILFLFIAFSGYLSGILAKMTDVKNITSYAYTQSIYGDGFLKISIMATTAAILLLFITPVLQRMLSDKKNLTCY